MSVRYYKLARKQMEGNVVHFRASDRSQNSTRSKSSGIVALTAPSIWHHAEGISWFGDSVLDSTPMLTPHVRPSVCLSSPLSHPP